MRTVGEYCSRRVVTARRDESLHEVARRMREDHVGCVVVVEPHGSAPNQPVGMLTDRDIVVRILALSDKRLEEVQAEDVMAEPVITIGETEELSAALGTMRSAGVRRLPVVDECNSVVGLLSLDDLICNFEGSLGEIAAVLYRERREEQRALPWKSSGTRRAGT